MVNRKAVDGCTTHVFYFYSNSVLVPEIRKVDNRGYLDDYIDKV